MTYGGKAPSPTRFVGGWARESEAAYVHHSGARIERRGYPEPYGWYLIPADPTLGATHFPPTPAGCDEAFLAFASDRYGLRDLGA